MALTDNQLLNLIENEVSLKLLGENGLNDSYYLSPLVYIQDALGLQLTCSGQEYRHAVEMAHDSDLCPEDAGLPVIVDGVLAFIYSDLLEEVGINLLAYFTYRFHPPSREFQDRLDKFEELVNQLKVEAN